MYNGFQGGVLYGKFVNTRYGEGGRSEFLLKKSSNSGL